jgi:hypothetical protein
MLTLNRQAMLRYSTNPLRNRSNDDSRVTFILMIVDPYPPACSDPYPDCSQIVEWITGDGVQNCMSLLVDNTLGKMRCRTVYTHTQASGGQ